MHLKPAGLLSSNRLEKASIFGKNRPKILCGENENSQLQTESLYN